MKISSYKGLKTLPAIIHWLNLRISFSHISSVNSPSPLSIFFFFYFFKARSDNSTFNNTWKRFCRTDFFTCSPAPPLFRAPWRFIVGKLNRIVQILRNEGNIEHSDNEIRSINVVNLQMDDSDFDLSGNLKERGRLVSIPSLSLPPPPALY